MERFRSIFGRMLFFTGIGVLAVITMLILLALIFEKQIRNVAINELNKQLASPVNVKSVHLSFFENFPQASLRFDEVKIRESYPGSQANVAEIGILSLSFNPLDILRGNYRISHLRLQDGFVSIKFNKEGLANYLIWKVEESGDTTSSQDFSIALEKINLENVELSYEDIRKKTDFSTIIIKAGFSGSFSAHEFLLNADAGMKRLTYGSGGVYYIKDKDVNLVSSIQVDNTNGIFTIKDANIEVQKAHFNVSGFAANEETSTKVDFNMKAKETSIKTLLALLPAAYAKSFEHYACDGKIHFDVAVKGMVNAVKSPVVLAEFGIRNGRIKDRNKKLALENVSFTGVFSNGKKQRNETSSLRISNFRARLGDRDIAGDLLVGNFTDPFITLGVMTNLNLANVSDFTDIKGIKKLSGDLFINASFKGKTNDLRKNKLGRTTLSGKMALKDVNVLPDSSGMAYTSMNGSFNFDGNNLFIESFNGYFGSSDFKINGSFRNLASFLFLKDEKLEAQARLVSNSINLDEFLVTDYTSKSKDTVSKFSLPAFLLFDLQLDVQNFQYRKMVAANISGRASFKDNLLKLAGVRFNTMDGKVTLNGDFEGTGDDKFTTKGKASLSGINIEKLFYQLENFGQAFITDKNLRGKLNADVDFFALWNPDLSVDMNSISSSAELKIDKGELISFDPLIQMGKFIKVKQMDHLHFNKLVNNITIKDKVITIPEMEIKSNAVNMAIAGTHTFGNYMDYKMKVNATQLFFGKREDFENEFGVVQVNEDGGINFHLLMKGPAENIAISYDGNSVKRGIKKELQKQKEELKNIFTDQKQPATSGNNVSENNNNNIKSKEKESNAIKAQKDYELKWEDEDDKTEPAVEKNQHSGKEKSRSSFDDFKNKLKATFK